MRSIYNFLIIGEAVKMLPQTVTDYAPGIPWRQIAGMRDKLTHAYFSIDRAFPVTHNVPRNLSSHYS